MSPFVQLQNHLAARKLKMTAQRALILGELLKSDGHASSEEIYDAVRLKEPSIGQATVYRTLKLLMEAGIAREVHFGDGITRYEAKVDRGHHDHLVCERCRKEVEFFDPAIEKLQEKQARDQGFLLTGHRMILFGVCSTCRG